MVTGKSTPAGIGLVALAMLATQACLPQEGATTAASRAAVTRCEAAPLGRVVVFERVPRDAGTWTFTASLDEVIPPADSGLTDFVFLEEGGARRRVAFDSPTGPPPLRRGETYAFRLDYVGGEPDAAAIVIEDEGGLLYAAATDQSPGEAVLREGLPGFAISLLPAECGSRLRDLCYEAVQNVGLAIEHEGTRAVLFQGESATLGRYRVECLTAQRVTYSPSCADAGLPGVSYVISRLR